MAYHILSEKGHIVTRSTVFLFTEDENKDPSITARCNKYTESMETIIGNYCGATLTHIDQEFDEEDPYKMFFDDHEDEQNEDVATNEYTTDSDPPSAENSDKLIGLKVNFNLDGATEDTIKYRKRTSDGLLVDTENPNPILDTHVYEVEFPDENSNEYSANIILENLYEKVDNNGRTAPILQGISADRSNDKAIQKCNEWTLLPNGARKRKVTTDG